ncbi:MAG: TlpA family protein disulfide reductase [Acidobacteria bacterium]|nr:MAG: TlpA family protein disulfide reductase [Acidobacteriota bacterium]REK12131.1 MAG: TlpA family protein disulfide reductase [Acidobacteriota bacterium]
MRINARVLIIGLAVVLPLVAFLAAGFRFDPHEMSSPLVGKPAPSFRLQSLDGEVWELEALRGKPVVVNFWSTWCAPCIQEHPALLGASRHYADSVQFLGVVYQDDTAAIASFQQRHGSWGPSLLDPGGKTAIAYGVYGPPETFFIGPDGVIVDKVIGAVSGGHLKRTLDGLL